MKKQYGGGGNKHNPIPDQVGGVGISPTSIYYKASGGSGGVVEAKNLVECRQSMTKKDYMEFHQACCDKMVSITKAKNADYSGDSLDPFANFQMIGHLVQLPNVVAIGFLTRMSDKLSRIGSFVTKGALQVKDESVEDTLLDLANYCILFAGYLRSQRGNK